MIEHLVACALVMLIIAVALVLIVAGPRGLAAVRRGGAGAASGLVAWSLGALGRAVFAVVTTAADVVITLGLMIYHLTQVNRAEMIGDDIAAFLHRLVARVERIFMR